MTWILGLMLACVLQPQQLRAATMLEELATLEEVHPLLRAGHDRVEAAKYGVLGSISGFLPKVTGTLTYGYESTQLAGAPGANQYNNFSANTKNAIVKQNLFNGLRTYSGFRSAQKRKKLSAISLEGTRQSVLLEGINAYINVRRSFQVVRIVRAEEEMIQMQQNLEDERVRKGAGISVDATFAAARLQLVKERLANVEGTLITTMSSYAQVFDHQPPIAEMTDPEDPKQLLPATLEDAIRTGLRMHPSILTANLQVEIAKLQVTSARSGYMPSLDLVGEYNQEEDKNGANGIKNERKINLEASWEIFSGFSTRAGEKQNIAQLSASRHTRYNTMRKIREGVEIAWQNLATQRARLTHLKNAADRAQEVYEGRDKLRRAGKETAVNVLDAQREVKNAEQALAFADYDAKKAIYRLLLSMGVLRLETL